MQQTHSINAALFFCFLKLLVGAEYLFANGGPVAWTRLSPQLGIHLTETKGVGLLREDLRIKLHKDLKSYDVKATYRLKVGASEDLKILFGVPLSEIVEGDVLTEPTEEELKQAAKKRAPELEKVCNAIRIDLGGKIHSSSAQPLMRENKPDSKVSSQDGGKPPPGSLKYFCVTELTLAKKSEQVLKLEYESELSYLDLEFSKSAMTVFDKRTLLYELYPAGYWQGNVGELHVDIDLGPYQNYVVEVFPKGFTKTATGLQLSAKDVDFKDLRELKIVFSILPLEFRQKVSWNVIKEEYKRYQLRIDVLEDDAKSTKDSSLKHLSDGKPDTVWCHRSAEPFELKIQTKNKHCARLEGLLISTGDLSSQTRYDESDRIRELTIYDCKGKERHRVLFDDVANMQEAMQFIANKTNEAKYEQYMKSYNEKFGTDYRRVEFNPPPSVLEFIQQDLCFKLRVTQWHQRPSDKACLSEIALVRNCG